MAMVGEDKVPDISADFAVAKDRGESPAEMEPLLIGETSRFRGSLTDFAVELAQKAAGIRRSLPESLLKSLADLVRSMNCYYSNLIEGHYTHPIDIERALKNDYSKDARKRDLQLEAKAHVAVQKWIDEGGLKGRAVATEGICEIHHRFCAELPETLLWVEDPEGKDRVRVVPGELRKRDVKVGGHVAISPGAVPRFLKRFEDVYGSFMESLMQPDRLRARILLWAEEEIKLKNLPPRSGRVLEALLYRGELPRGDVASAAGVVERHARRVVSALMDRGVLASDSPRAPLRLVFPATLAARWMPGLFPERP